MEGDPPSAARTSAAPTCQSGSPAPLETRCAKEGNRLLRPGSRPARATPRECCAWSRRQRTRRGKPWGELRPRHISRDTPSEHRKPLHCFNFSSSESTLHTPAHGVQGENPSKRITKPRSSSASRCRQVPLAAGVRPPGCPRRLARALAHCRSSVTKAALVCSQKLPLWLT